MKLKLVTIMCLALFFTEPSFSQENFNTNHFHFFYGSPIPEKTGFQKFLERFYIGFSYPFASLTIKEHFTKYQGSNIIDTTVSKSVKNLPSGGAFIGFHVPLAYIGENSGCLALSAEIMGSYTSWDVKPISLSASVPSAYDKGTATSIAVGLPIALEYKYGADAILDKYKKFMFTFGVGGTPTAYTNTFVKSATTFEFVPFVKAEIGYFAGVGMKLRGTFSFGTLDYVAWQATDRFGGGDYTDTKVTGKPAVTVSYIIIPWSRRWRDED